MDPELKLLFDSDRADHATPRIAGSPEYADLRKRDLQRREKVRRILRDDVNLDARDLYHAAWILNHGDQPEEAELAYRLARQSHELGNADGKWLSAAALDRWLMYSGLPQKFGTQIVPDGQRYRLWDYDTNTTDEERARYNVLPLAQLEQRAARDSGEMPQPPLNDAPAWLRQAVERWRSQELAELTDAARPPRPDENAT